MELFSYGKVTCDHFGGIRALLIPERIRHRKRWVRRIAASGVRISGRWSLIDRPAGHTADYVSTDEVTKFIAKTLLDRYGVVFSSMLSREVGIYPSWGELLRVYRRMEDRGEVRGGRFVADTPGEQFALPGAVEVLRDVSKRALDRQSITVSATDPLNLAGVLTSESRVASVVTNHLVIENGTFRNWISDGRVREFATETRNSKPTAASELVLRKHER